MFWSCLFCVAACLRVCVSACLQWLLRRGDLCGGAVCGCRCVVVGLCRRVAALRCRGVAEEARRRFTCRLRRATVLLFGRVIDTS